MNKTELTIILLISAVIVLYPQISTLIDVLNMLSEQSFLTQATLKARDNAILYVLGFVLLYVFLYLFLNSNFEKQPTQQVKPSTDNIPTQQVRQIAPLSKNAKTWIYLISGLVFLGVYFWQFIPSVTEGYYTPLGSAMASFPISIIAACIAGISLYFLFKYAVEVE